MKNGLMAHGLYLCLSEGNSAWLRLPPFVYVPHLTTFVSPPCTRFTTGLRPHLSLNSPRENGKQSEANCRAAAARHTQVEREVPRALTGRSLAVSKQQLADGCEAEMIHTDSTVPAAVPWKID